MIATPTTHDPPFTSGLAPYAGTLPAHISPTAARNCLSCGQGKHYHAKEDDMRWINFAKLAHNTRFVSDIIARIDATPADADRTPCDPFDLEMRMLRRALGPAQGPVLARFGNTLPTCREDLDGLLDELLHGIPHQTAAGPSSR